jgi:hypothetical protein
VLNRDNFPLRIILDRGDDSNHADTTPIGLDLETVREIVTEAIEPWLDSLTPEE